MMYRVDDIDRSFYRILGVDRCASIDEIRVAHRRLAQTLHPDKQAGRSEQERALAERRMREVNEAWSVLSNPSERELYDSVLTAAEVAAGVESAVNGHGNPGGARSGGGHDRRVADNFDNADPAFGRAFHRVDNNSSDYVAPDGTRVGALEFDADEMTPEERRRLNARGTVIVSAVAVIVVLFLVITAYAGSVSDPPDRGGQPRTTTVSTVESSD